MTEQNEQTASFKVVDRRRFDDEGEAREDVQANVEKPAVADVSPKPASAPKLGLPPGTITFSMFIQGLAHQTLMAMGLVPWPDSGLIEPKFDHARETIDIMDILHAKTAGNLSVEEKRMFDTLLYELRMTFVQLTQKNDSSPPAPLM